MATYLKRTSKLFDITLSQTARTTSEMNLRDLMCPICRGILIEPVTLPCTHNLCLKCLKGTFEHNSLSCPLCRVRVGSWLRTATKTESLVNNDLWEHIRTKYSKEIEGKNIDDVPDIHSQDAYVPKLLSAPGEIRREYELQLQKASEEMRKQRENEIIANEQFIRQIQHEEEKQKFAQLAQDQLLARTLAKKQIIDRDKTIKYYNDYLRNTAAAVRESKILAINDKQQKQQQQQRLPTFDKTETTIVSHDNSLGYFINDKESTDLQKLNMISKHQQSDIDGGVKPLINTRLANTKICCDHTIPIQGLITVKNQSLMMHKDAIFGSINLQSEPSCSSKIYGQRSTEELRVPSDVLRTSTSSNTYNHNNTSNNSNSNDNLNINCKKIVEVAMTSSGDDKRIESPASAGSHDSINPEIHHFKPIKALPRTPLKLSADGRQIDTKIIRVMPILKRIVNPIFKAPVTGSIKRITGCSWSAFREFIVIGKAAQQKLQKNITKEKSTGIIKSSENNKVTSDIQQLAIVNINNGTTVNLSICDIKQKSNTKTINRLLNGTKINNNNNNNNNNNSNNSNNNNNNGNNNNSNNKKLIYNNDNDNDQVDTITFCKSTKSQALLKNDILNSTNTSTNSTRTSRSRKKNNIKECVDNSEESFTNFFTNINSATTTTTTTRTTTIVPTTDSVAVCSQGLKLQQNNYHDGVDADDDGCGALENIAERIKRRKLNVDVKKNHNFNININAINNNNNNSNSDSNSNVDNSNDNKLHKPTRTKNVRKKNLSRNTDDSKKSVKKLKRDKSSDSLIGVKRLKLKKKMTDEMKIMTNCTIHENKNKSRITRNSAKTFGIVNNNRDNDNENIDQVIAEQAHMERILMQERADFELAQRLQAEFNEMERVSGRTRGSRRALERTTVNFDTSNMSNVSGKLSNATDGIRITGKTRRRRCD